jgi:site-specific DNA-methyltransferase (adenine-specific)
MDINTIVHGNCFEKLKEFSTNSDVKLVLTDPPYLHNKGGGKTSGTEGKSSIANSDMYNFGSFMMTEMSSFSEEQVYQFLDEINRIMKKMNCFVFCNDTLIPYYTMWANNNKKKFTVLTWEKPLSIMNRNRFSQNLEYVVRIYDINTALNKLDIDAEPQKKDYYSKNRRLSAPTNRVHPTQKPLDYLMGIIELCTDENDLVLDPFFGSGQTGVACVKLKRNYIGIEFEEDYVKLAETQIKKASPIESSSFFTFA